MHDLSTLRDGEVRAFGIRSPTIEAGPADASEAAVFVHGNPGSRLDWTDLVRRTGEFARAIALDLPGFGQADKPRRFPYSVPAMARFLAAALEVLGIRRVHLVVHDFGGPFGLAWAAEHPDDFASVAIINAPPVSGYRWYPLAHVWRTPIAGEILHVTLLRPIFGFLARIGNPKGLPEAFVDRMWRNYDPGTRHAVLVLYRATDARRMVPASPAVFAALDRPALVVWGRHDVYIPPRFAEAHRRAFPHARIAYLDGSGHFPMIDDPEAVAAEVIPFLRNGVGTAGEA